jgi:hypothetical protein
VTTIREIDHEGERVETGPTRIGNDWCGLFIRGDNCFGSAAYLRPLLARLNATAPQDRETAFFDALGVNTLRNLIAMMESTNEATHR